MTDINVDLVTENVEIPINIEKKVSDYNILDNKPSINGVELVGDKTTADLGIEVDTSKFPTREELNEYVKNTDYATADKGGVIKQSTTYGFSVNASTGVPFASTKGLAGYQNSDGNMFIGKNTLENIKDDLVKRGITENTIELTDDEKTNTRTWIGAVGTTDYATASKAGILTPSSYYATAMSGQYLYTQTKTLDQYKESVNGTFIGKGTLENIKDDYVKRGITANQTELTEDEKAGAKQWLGYATQSDINTAIANLPQFKISILDTLPETGEKMVLYLVPKDGEAPDVYNEYIWIEDTSSFEFLGSTAVDLTDYVKKTDYAQGSVAGVVKASGTFACGATNGYLQTTILPVGTRYDNLSQYAFIGKGTLENIKNDLVKRAVTTNDIELTEDEKTSARTWLGAIGDTDYAGIGGKAGVIKVSATYGFAVAPSNGYLAGISRTLEQFETIQSNSVISKGTLDNVLTQYSKTVLTTETDYEALETKDANTLYLIEEE